MATVLLILTMIDPAEGQSWESLVAISSMSAERHAPFPLEQCALQSVIVSCLLRGNTHTVKFVSDGETVALMMLLLMLMHPARLQACESPSATSMSAQDIWRCLCWISSATTFAIRWRALSQGRTMSRRLSRYGKDGEKWQEAFKNFK